MCPASPGIRSTLLAISYHLHLNHSLDSKVISISGGDGGSCARSLLPPAVPCARAVERTYAPNSNPRTNELNPPKHPQVCFYAPKSDPISVVCQYSVDKIPLVATTGATFTYNKTVFASGECFFAYFNQTSRNCSLFGVLHNVVSELRGNNFEMFLL